MNYKSLTDHQLIEKIVGNDPVAIDHLLGVRCQSLFRYIKYNLLKYISVDEKDLENEIYLYLRENDWEKLRAFRFESKLQTWINLVASRYLLKKFCKEMKENSRKGTPIDSIRSFADEDNNNRIVRAELLEAIGNLKDKRDQLILLLTLQGYDPGEIGEQLGTNTNNVYTIKSRAIDKLRRLL
jgi:RNA polymerase sigma factor (sigma-70 family)